MTSNIRALFPTTVSLAVATALFSAAPFEVNFDPAAGSVGVVASMAMAKDGDDDSGGGGRGSDDRGGRDDRSGRGSDDSGGRDDRSGRGSDDRSDRDDRSGRSSDDRSGRDDRDNARNDDNRGRGRGMDDSSGESIEVTLSDGSRIEIENGRFERKDANGRTIEERPARRSDYARLQQAGTSWRDGPRRGANGTVRAGGTVAKIEVSGNNVEISYIDGWKEEIENGRYQLKDAQNRTVIERAARPSDEARLLKVVR